MQTITGSIYPINFEGITIDADRAGRYIEVPTADTLTIFERVGVQESDIALNELGLYSNVRLNGRKTVKFGRIKAPEHVLQSRKNGCVWNPKGRIRQDVDEFPTCPDEVNMEICPDAWWNDCYEQLYGSGNKVRDMLGTPQGAQMMQMLLSVAYEGVGNSFSQQFHFANHPFIEAANTEGFYNKDDGTGTDELAWADYYDQQTGIDCAGIITIIDALANEGVDGYNIEIPDSDIDDVTNEYTGDIIALFNLLISRTKGAFSKWITNGARVRGVTAAQNSLYRATNGKVFPIILCTAPEFQAYEDYLVATFGQIPAIYQFFLTGTDGTGILMPGVLRYKGMAVVKWDEVGTFDSIVGTTSHRVAIAAPGVFGVAYDIEDLAMYRGMGMRITQKLEPPYQGKIFMDTTFRWGAGLIDKDFMVMASNIRVVE